MQEWTATPLHYGLNAESRKRASPLEAAVSNRASLAQWSRPCPLTREMYAQRGVSRGRSGAGKYVGEGDVTHRVPWNSLRVRGIRKILKLQ